MQWQNDRPAMDRGTILVAGNTLFTDIVGEMVERSGFSPAYPAAEEAPRLSLTRTHPCVVICDCAAPGDGIQRLIAATASRRIPLVLSDTRMQQREDAETLPPHVAWLTFPISQAAFSEMLDGLVPPSTDVVQSAAIRIAGVTIDAAVSMRPLSRVLAPRDQLGSRMPDRRVGGDGAELADVADLRSAIAAVLAATPVYEQSLRRGVWTYVGAERDAGTSPGHVIMALTELVDAAGITPMSVARALTRRVILWSVEAYFGQLGGAAAGSNDSTLEVDIRQGAPLLVSNR